MFHNLLLLTCQYTVRILFSCDGISTEKDFGVINMKHSFLSAKLVIRLALFLWRIFHIIAQFLQMAFQKEQSPLAFCASGTCRAQKWYSTGHKGTCYP